MTFDLERAQRQPWGRSGPAFSARAAAGEEDFAFKGPAVLVVSMGCAMSGLVAGLCLAAVHQPLLAFLLGAALAGGLAWFGRDLAERLRIAR